MKSKTADIINRFGKSLAAAWLIIAMLLGLVGCSKNGKNAEKGSSGEVDATTISEKIVPPSYSLLEDRSDGTLWTSNFMSVCDGMVYYIGSDSQQYYICTFDPDTLEDEAICPSNGRNFLDVAVSSDGYICVLATVMGDDSAYEIIKLDLSGSLIGEYPISKINKNGEWVPKEIECYQDKLFILSDKYLVSASLNSELKQERSMEVEPSAQLSKTSEGNILLCHTKDGKFYLQTYAPDKLNMVSSVVFNMTFSSVSGGETWDVFLSDNNALY